MSISSKNEPRIGRRLSDESDAKAAGKWGILEFVALSQTLLPAVLLIPGTQAARLPIRISAYAISLVALVLFWNRRRGSHPSEPVLCLAVCLLFLMIFHPLTNTPLAGLAQTMLYVSVMAPLFWVPGLITGAARLNRILWILLAANGLNSFVGVMQVYDPGRWMPEEFSAVQLASAYGLEGVSYTGPGGVVIIRPPGLFDTPGAVCGAGTLAGVLGFVLFMRPGGLLAKTLSAAFGVLGIAAILLSQVRTALLITIGGMAVYVIVMLMRKDVAQALGTLFVCTIGAFAALSLGLALGGDAVKERITTLTADDPVSVYFESKRGEQMEHAILTHAREYPLGAGLGRWGMMRKYFGDESNRNSPMIWSELQIPSWLLDGGIPFVILYGLALALAAKTEVISTLEADGPAAREWGPVVVALNAGTIALILGFTPFTSPVGLQYWFLVGCFYGTCRSEEDWS